MARRHARGRAHKLERQPELCKLVLQRLGEGWSPEQIAGRRPRGRAAIASVTNPSTAIFIGAVGRSTEPCIACCLAKSTGAAIVCSVADGRKTSILERVSIHDRPAVVDSRMRSGDGEADLMSFRKPGQFLLVAQERTSRRALLMRQKTRTAQSVADNLSAMVEAMPASACQSMTFDNGTEFSKHYLLNRRFGIQTWFCDTHSPWQKGGIENAIGRLRRQLPRKTDLDALPVHDLELCLQRYNDTPRKCLAFKTPNEVFLQLSVALQT